MLLQMGSVVESAHVSTAVNHVFTDTFALPGLRVHPEDWPKLKEAMRQSSFSGSALDFDYR